MNHLDKEMIRLVLAGDRKFVKLADLKPVCVGHWPEVSVKGLYDEYIKRPQVMMHCPPKNEKKRPLDKTYLFNIINTFHGEEL